VHRAGHRVAQDLRLRDADREHVLHARERVIGAVLVVTDVEEAHEALRVVGEEPAGEHQEDEERDVLSVHGMRLSPAASPHAPRS